MRSIDFFILSLLTSLAILYVDLFYRIPPENFPGRDGRDGLPGRDGIQGLQGEKGDSGPQGPPGPKSGGITYTRWGNSSCPDTPGTERVYHGRAAGSWYDQQGGGARKICLPEEPQYHPKTSLPAEYSVLHGSEYETAKSGPLQEFHDENVPCTVCYVALRNTALMIPARVECPPDWTIEYNGYLMTASGSHQRSSIDCIDIKPGKINGGSKNTAGALFYHVIIDGTCNGNGLQCPPYMEMHPLACVVCTK